MKFEIIAIHLISLHNQLWFRTADGIIACQDKSAWRASEILTTEGRIVAMQTGGPDEWQLAPGSGRPDIDFTGDLPSRVIPFTEAVVIAEQQALQDLMGNDLPVRPLKRIGSS